jgi:hypothetical protein
LLRACLLRPLPGNARFLQCHYLATAVVYGTITFQRLLYTCFFDGRCLATSLMPQYLRTMFISAIYILSRIYMCVYRRDLDWWIGFMNTVHTSRNYK